MILPLVKMSVMQHYISPRMCSLQFTDTEPTEKYGQGKLEVSFHEWGLPHPSNILTIRPLHPKGKLTICSMDVLAKMQEPRRFPHLRQINRMSENRYELILACYLWTEKQIEELRNQVATPSLHEVPCIDYVLAFDVDYTGVGMSLR